MTIQIYISRVALVETLEIYLILFVTDSHLKSTNQEIF